VLAQTFAAVFTVLRYLGAAYLLFLAWKMWRAPAELPEDALPAGGQHPWRMFGAGLLVTLGNPKIMVFYMALLPTLVDLGRLGPLGWGQLTLTMLLVWPWSTSAGRCSRPAPAGFCAAAAPCGSPTAPAPR
jgi:threonine/homoserine/homoserine lactone efflux protein